MPCNDITEQVRVVLDRKDCLKSYKLFKKTCGIAVGAESILSDKLVGLSIDDFLRLDEFASYRLNVADDQLEKFLNLKHLFAIRATLTSFTGKDSAGVNDTCTIVSVSYDGDDTIIDAEINIGLLTEKIEACTPP